VLRVLLNADLDKAVGMFVERDGSKPAARIARPRPAPPGERAAESDEHWRWRLRMAEAIGAALDAERFGVRALYVFGSTKNANAAATSDLDLLVHVVDDAAKHEALTLWLEGWNRALSESNYLRTGYRVVKLLDVHPITDRDIENRSSYASKIGAVTDAAREIPLGAR
jgi:predicted nucleotidyltransferase